MSAKCNNKGASKCGKTSWSLSDLFFFSEGLSMLKWFLSLTFVIPEWQPPEAVPWYYPGQSCLPCDLRFWGDGALHASNHQRKQVQDYPRHQVWPQTHFYSKISSPVKLIWQIFTKNCMHFICDHPWSMLETFSLRWPLPTWLRQKLSWTPS